MKTLIFGVFGGELGWNVCAWIAAMRKAAERFERVVAVCQESCKYLHEDFATDFEFYEPIGRPDMWYVNRHPDKLCEVPKRILEKYPGATYYTPSRKKCLDWPRKYFRYGNMSESKYDIVVHARAETKYGQENRNWPNFRFKRLLEKYDGERICSVGTKAEHVPNSVDLRNIPLNQLCDILHNAKVCIGPSSGVMHLAHLCGCPIIVWTDSKEQKAIDATNKQRYTRLWRAWDTPVVVIDTGWQPEVKEVAAELKRFV